MRYVSLNFLMWLSLAACANAEPISLWHFNDAATGASGGEIEFLVDSGNGIMKSNFEPANIGNSTGSTLNSLPGCPAGRSLLLSGNANNGKNLTWTVDTSDYSGISVSFATRRTSTGFNLNQFFYSADSGASWAAFGLPYEPESDFGLVNFDLGHIHSLDNNPGAGFRILFDGATSYSGNNRIDNLFVSGTRAALPPVTPVPEPATAVLLGLGLLGVLLIRKKTV